MARNPVPRAMNFIRVRAEPAMIEQICRQGGLEASAYLDNAGLFRGTAKLFVTPTAEGDHMRKLRQVLGQYGFQKFDAMWEPQQVLE